jgi:hypothetical protein
MFDMRVIEQVANTNKYLQKEVEDRDWVIKGLKAKLAFLSETIYGSEDELSAPDLLEALKDILAEEASTFAIYDELEEEFPPDDPTAQARMEEYLRFPKLH